MVVRRRLSIPLRSKVDSEDIVQSVFKTSNLDRLFAIVRDLRAAIHWLAWSVIMPRVG